MCFSETTSWVTLAVGTICNVVSICYLLGQTKKDSRALIPMLFVVLWQFSLLMQLPDALAWRNIKRDRSTTSSGRLAYILNVTQPLIAWVAAMVIVWKMGSSPITLYPATFAMVVYCILLLISLIRGENSYDVEPTAKGCSTLTYRWWPRTSTLVFYWLVIILAVLAIPSLKWAALEISIFIISFVIGLVLANFCSSGSMWCWTVASAGAITTIAYLLGMR